MKKDRMRELLTELRDREFSFDECFNLFSEIDHFCSQSGIWRNMCGTEFESDARRWLDDAEASLRYLLSDMGLDYTLDEFITYD